MQVSLAKALNIKNRVAGELSKLARLMQTYNSTVESKKLNFNLEEIFKKWQATRERLIAIKTTIAKANVDIYGKIYEIAELKSYIASLRSFSTKEGEEKEGGRFGAEVVKTVYVAYLKDSQIESLVTGAEERINSLQDEISTFNHTTKVEIPE